MAIQIREDKVDDRLYEMDTRLRKLQQASVESIGLERADRVRDMAQEEIDIHVLSGVSSCTDRFELKLQQKQSEQIRVILDLRHEQREAK